MTLFSRDLGIDLGSSTTLIYAKGRGILFSEASAIATETGSRHVVAVGTAANEMVGRTPANIVANHPVSDGVIADFDMAKLMLGQFIRRAIKGTRFTKPRVVVGVPSGVTDVERRAFFDAAIQAGCREAFLIEEPLAAAIGCDLPISSPIGHMIVDIGGGTTDIAIISLGGIVTSESLKIAGTEMDEAIIQHAKKRYNLLLGARTAEQVKIEAGSATPGRGKEAFACGMDLITRLPRCLVLESDELCEAMTDPCRQICQSVRAAIERCPPELLSDIVRSGIVLTGGGSLLYGMADLLQAETSLPARVAENAFTAVVTGTGKALDQIRAMRQLIRLRKHA